MLVIAYDVIGPRMAGPGIRAWNIACSLADAADVTVTFSDPIRREHPGVATVQWTSEHHLGSLAQAADIVVCQGLALRHHPQLKEADAALYIDMYDPWVFENIQLHDHLSDHDRFHAVMHEAFVLNELIDAGDFFFCASERQRDYWLGMLTSRGRIDAATWRADPGLRCLIDVVPYGCPNEAPLPAATPAVRGVVPGIDDSSTLLLWSGGAWEWFDPLLAIDALALALQREPGLRMFFMGLGLAGRTADMPIVAKLHERIASHGIGDAVAFGTWVPYDDRASVLLEADGAVLATSQTAETRLSFRSRVLDHLWAGVPTITTPGDVLAELLDEAGAGMVVPFGDADAMADAFVTIARARDRCNDMARASRELARTMTWEHATRSLRERIMNVDDVLKIRVARQRDAAAASSIIRPRLAPDVLLHQAARAIGDAGGAPAALLPPRDPARHGRLIERLKRTRVYPLLRRVRRSTIGVKCWGPLPPDAQV